MTSEEHLRGPWVAVISHRGESYNSIRTARIELGDDGGVDISVRRGTALPHEDDDGYLPGSYRTGDVAYEIEDAYLVDDGDPSTAAEARYIQAQAMAAGLNAAADHHARLAAGTEEALPAAQDEHAACPRPGSCKVYPRLLHGAPATGTVEG